MQLAYITLLFFGFLAAVVGVSLPGLLNMNAVKIANEDSYQSAYRYVLGALVVIFIQTYIAIFFAKLIDSSAAITAALHEIGLVIFGGLTIYFLGFAKKREHKKENRSKLRQVPFFYGALLAAINVFPIPYYVFLSVTIASYHYPIFARSYTAVFSLGVVSGSALMFFLYVFFFKKISREDAFLLHNINYVIGTITGIISLITVYKLVI